MVILWLHVVLGFLNSSFENLELENLKGPSTSTRIIGKEGEIMTSSMELLC